MKIGARVVHRDGGPMGTVTECSLRPSRLPLFRVAWDDGRSAAWYDDYWIRRAPWRRRLHRFGWITLNAIERRTAMNVEWLGRILNWICKEKR